MSLEPGHYYPLNLENCQYGSQVRLALTRQLGASLEELKDCRLFIHAGSRIEEIDQFYDITTNLLRTNNGQTAFEIKNITHINICKEEQEKQINHTIDWKWDNLHRIPVDLYNSVIDAIQKEKHCRIHTRKDACYKGRILALKSGYIKFKTTDCRQLNIGMFLVEELTITEHQKPQIMNIDLSNVNVITQYHVSMERWTKLLNCIGKKVEIKMRSGNTLRGTLDSIRRESLRLEDIHGDNIRISEIEWIKPRGCHSIWFDEAKHIMGPDPESIKPEDRSEKIKVFANANEIVSIGDELNGENTKRTVTLCGSVRFLESRIRVIVGWAVCHPVDEFDWNLAKHISSKRANREHCCAKIVIDRKDRSNEELRDHIHALLEKHAEYALEQKTLWEE